MTYQDFFKAHRQKLVIGAPIVFLLLVNVSGISGENLFSFTSEKSVFTIVGDTIPVTLEVSAKEPINAIGGKLVFPQDTLQAENVVRENSIIDLWSEEPLVTNDSGAIRFSGGIIQEKGINEISGQIFTTDFLVTHTGKAKIQIEEGQLLAKNGEGTNIYSGQNTITIYARDKGYPSPDINNDGVLSLSDVNSLYLKTFGDYNEAYDMNMDGKVSWDDVTHLVSLLR